jgi:xylulokinase
MKILAVDIGTSAMKMAVFDEHSGDLTLLDRFSSEYMVNTYNNGLYSDIEPEKWLNAFAAGCKEMAMLMPDVDLICLSGTTPGLVPMDAQGKALIPAILMLDQRSSVQARRIIDTVGMETLLATTANMPVPGGCSLASILWIKEELPDTYARTHVFGHSNTFFGKFLAGRFGIDPSSASLTGLYNTASNDMSWNDEIAKVFGLSLHRLPELMPAHKSIGRVTESVAARFNLRKQPPVLIGGNDAVLAAYSAGINEEGDIFDINGTSEITMVCLAKCLPSKNYNIRKHVLKDRWVSFNVLNACGKAFDWFRSVFCSEMKNDDFFGDFMPFAISKWINRSSKVTYVPYLMGSRYSLRRLKAQFLGLTFETSRDEMLAALVRGLYQKQRHHLQEIAREIQLGNQIVVSGGALNPALIEAKKKWMKNCRYIFRPESSLIGAAMLGQIYRAEDKNK